MKTRSILAIFLVATVAVATERVRFEADPTSNVRITGTSTLHEWSMEGSTINGAIDIAPELAANPLEAQAWRREKSAVVTVRIPLAAIKSDHDRMNNIMLAAMKASANPEIRYELTQAAAESSGDDSFVVKTKGRLTIAGVTRDLEMSVTAKRDGDKRYLLTGEAPIKMTDFGITPPVAMLGTLKTGNDVKVSFRWVVDRIQ
jgi:hypothetical protein